MNASPSTNANTIGRRAFMTSLKSFEPAVMPVTLTSVPLTFPIVCGMTSSRSLASAASERASVPSPASGMSTCASVWSGFVVTVTGWPKPFVLGGGPLQVGDPGLHRGRVDVIGLDDDRGRQRAARELVLDAVVGLHDRQAARQARRRRG